MSAEGYHRVMVGARGLPFTDSFPFRQMPIDGKSIPRRLLLGYRTPHGGEDARLCADARVCRRVDLCVGVWVRRLGEKSGRKVWERVRIVLLQYECVCCGACAVNTIGQNGSLCLWGRGGPVRPRAFPPVRRWVGQRLPHD
jgi:hypothetical protein